MSIPTKFITASYYPTFEIGLPANTMTFKSFTNTNLRNSLASLI